MRSAISVCESPSKYASSITWRWFGVSFSDGRLYLAGFIRAQDVLLHVAVQRGMVGLFEFHGVALTSAGAAQVVDGAIARHGQQPRPDGALLRVEAVNAVPDAQEGFLHQVFRDAAHRAPRARSASR